MMRGTKHAIFTDQPRKGIKKNIIACRAMNGSNVRTIGIEVLMIR